MTTEITTRQRNVQREKIEAAIALLKVAALETQTATPSEMAETIDVALEIVEKVNQFLKSRPVKPDTPYKDGEFIRGNKDENTS